MIDDTLSRYGLSRRTGEAVLKTLEAVAAREGHRLPSSDVIDRAMTELGSPTRRNIARVVTPAMVYKIRSRTTDRVHLVALYFSGAMLPAPSRHLVIPNHRTIVDAECSCDASSTCWHLLVSLTMAEIDGYSLKFGNQ